MLDYQAGEECLLTSCHLITKTTRRKNEESSLREQEVLHLRKENSCISIKASIVSMNLLVAKARIPLTSWNFLKKLSLPFDQEEDFPCKPSSKLTNSKEKNRKYGLSTPQSKKG